MTRKDRREDSGANDEGLGAGAATGVLLGSLLLAAACCLGPVLIALVGAVGVSALLGYASYALAPALVIALGLIGYRIYVRRCGMTSSGAANTPTGHSENGSGRRELRVRAPDCHADGGREPVVLPHLYENSNIKTSNE